MITTVTLNTALDKLYLVEKLTDYSVMRVQTVSNTAGGKGLNVSRVAALAGEDVTAMGFVGGFNGDYAKSMLEKQGICTKFTSIQAETRSCINVREISTGKHTEFLEPGAKVSEEELNAFLESYKAQLPESSVIAISGSVPAGTPADFYATLVTLAKEAGKKVILDTSGQVLIDSVKAKPTMIKPNTDEIEQLLGKKVTSREEIIDAALELHESGIEIVVVSLGKDGSLIACAEGVFQGITPDIPVINTVGCGDSMVAGFCVGIERGYSIEETINFATAISTANALTIETGYFLQEDLTSLLNDVAVKRLR